MILKNKILKKPNEKAFSLNPTTKEELEDNLKFLKENKAVVINSIPTKILKNLRKVISQPLSDLLNLIFYNGTFPDARNNAFAQKLGA